MFKRICVTNRKLCKDFYKTIDNVINENPNMIILREKDLSSIEYEQMAIKVLDKCKTSQIECVMHCFTDVAKKLEVKKIHLPLHKLRKMKEEDKKFFEDIGASCHSVDEAIEAERLGATYITAGHIFKTDCKKGVEPKGLVFLKEVRRSVNIPVYAIGGINEENMVLVKNVGVSGACMMSEYMKF